MNTRSFLTLFALSTLNPQLSTAQGSLTPPAGPPVASMKTLDQVEARIPLVAGQPGVAVSAAGTITISQPGSYYLTKNVTITTNVSGVVINAPAAVDLNGFAIIGTAAAISTAPAVSAGDFDFTLRNGSIQGGTVVTTSQTPSTSAGFLDGVQSAGLTAKTARISDLTITGMRGTGINLQRNSLIERCQVRSVGGAGILAAAYFADPNIPIHAIVRECQVSQCSGVNAAAHYNCGIFATSVSHSFAHILAGNLDPGSEVIGIRADTVEYSKGWATGEFLPGATSIPNGIFGRIVCWSSGKGGAAIGATQAVACFSEGGSINGGKQLGTPP